MGNCQFSSSELRPDFNPASHPTYSFFPTGPRTADQFGVPATIDSFFGSCYRASQITPTLTASGLSVPCSPISVSSGVPQQSVLCPVQKTAIPSSFITILFNDPLSELVPYTFSVGDGVTTVRAAATTCVTPTPVTPGKCNRDNLLRGLGNRGPTAFSFCSSYLATPTIPLPSYLETIPPSRINSVCSCLQTSSPAVTPTPKCNADNCLRALKGQSASGSGYCSALTSGAPATPAANVNSACQYNSARLSSACTCFAPAPTASLAPRSPVTDVLKMVKVVKIKRAEGFSGPDATVSGQTVTVYTTTLTTTSDFCGSTLT